ncbi:MAG: hypothetical protein JXR94_17400, partial [Candidatus Hydrogenedentes bacterium]|nr:hypothetical protein [Candidatus Hydrogenedentota bacterium]
VLAGRIQSDLPLEGKTTVGSQFVSARTTNVEAEQRISLTVTFDDVHIHLEGLPEEAGPAVEEGTELVRKVSEDTAAFTEGMELIVDAPLGDIRIEGTDEDAVRVKASKLARLQSKSNASAVLDAIELSVKTLDNRIRIQTHVQDNMESLGCTYYRVDLEIQCPRTAPLKVTGANGHTSVSSMGGPVFIEQMDGVVAIEHVKGQLEITNHKGDVQVFECGGPLTLSVKDGTATTRDIYGKQAIDCLGGKVIVDAPHGEVFVNSRGGDVRIIALDGVDGDYGVRVEGGDLSLLVPSTADATLYVTATNGIVFPAIPLTGSIDGPVRKYQGRLNNGRYTLTLETKDGDIAIID